MVVRRTGRIGPEIQMNAPMVFSAGFKSQVVPESGENIRLSRISPKMPFLPIVNYSNQPEPESMSVQFLPISSESI
jgi:hypothetical protein